MKRFFLSVFLLITVLSFGVNANAMTGTDFIKITSSLEQRNALEPFIVEYVAQGYKNVPNWAELSMAVNEAIRKNGWGKRDLKGIAIDAAKIKGMTK